MTTPKSVFPGFRWSPDGEARVFHRAEDVPEGWTDFHPANAPAAPDEKRSDTVLTRQQIVDGLKERGVLFQRNASTQALYDKLVEAVERNGGV